MSIWRDIKAVNVALFYTEMPESFRVNQVNGYPAKGRNYELYAYTDKYVFKKVITKPCDMCHSGDEILGEADGWTKTENIKKSV